MINDTNKEKVMVRRDTTHLLIYIYGTKHGVVYANILPENCRSKRILRKRDSWKLVNRMIDFILNAEIKMGLTVHDRYILMIA